jgi:hypothetical protein
MESFNLFHITFAIEIMGRSQEENNMTAYERNLCCGLKAAESLCQPFMSFPHHVF